MSLMVNGHPSKTLVSDEPASQVVNSAVPAHVLGVQRGYIMVAIPVSSLALAAAVVKGTGVNVGMTVTTDVGVGTLLADAAGDDDDPHDASTAITAIDAIATSFLNTLT